MKHKILSAPGTLAMAIAFAGATMQVTYAAPGGRGGGRGGGGLSREGPAASGSFSSREGSMQGRQPGAEANRPRAASSGQVSRQQYGANSQASRQQYGSAAQANREQYGSTAQANREQTAEQYHGSHPYARPYAPYAHWDAGTGVAVATGAAIGAAAASSGSSTVAVPVSGMSAPCADSAVVTAGNATYMKCGSHWYTEAYGPSGPTFVQVAPPPGY